MIKYINKNIAQLIVALGIFLTTINNINAQSCYGATAPQIDFPENGGFASRTITHNCSGGFFSLGSFPDWVTSANIVGTTLTVNVPENTDEERSGWVNILWNNGLSGRVKVTQDGTPPPPPPPPPSCTVTGFDNGDALDGSQQTITYTLVYSNCSGQTSYSFKELNENYEPVDLPYWVSVTQPNQTTINVTFLSNDTANERSVIIVGNDPNGVFPGINESFTQPCLARTWYADSDGDGFRNPDSIGEPDCNNRQGNWTTNPILDNCPNEYDGSNECHNALPDNPSDQNYIYTRTYQKNAADMQAEDGIDQNNFNFFTQSEAVIQSIVYFDGLGRPMQQVAIAQSAVDGANLGKKDIVTHIEYDNFGRQIREWLPFVEPNGEMGKFRTGDMKGATRDYYDDPNTYGDDFPSVSGIDVNPYSEKYFETSPLNRILKQAAPGEDWALAKDAQGSVVPDADDHAIEFGYLANSTDEVRLFLVNLDMGRDNPVLNLNAYYTANELYKTITRDENHSTVSGKLHTIEEFKNKQGQVVLKRTYADIDLNDDGTVQSNEKEIPHDTYYVYDDYGNLTYVIPPKVDTSNGVTTVERNELCYQYKYDHRNRLVEKKLPGKGWEHIVYNTLDQPVMTQDTVQRANNEWSYTKYDAFGRVVLAGILDLNVTRTQAQANVESAAAQYEERVGDVYTNNTYPSIFNSSGVPQIHVLNFYDDYNFPLFGYSLPTTVLGQTVAQNVKGLSTGGGILVLDGNDDKWIRWAKAYDEKGRVIAEGNINELLQTFIQIETKLDFVGRPEKVVTTHTKGANAPIVTVDNFEYDHVGRLLSQTQCIGDGTLGDTCPRDNGGGMGQIDVDLLLSGNITTDQVASNSIAVSPVTTISGDVTLRIEGSSGAEELIVYNKYDELGQLIAKKVGGIPGADYGATAGLQTVNYEYNVRGWLKQINNTASLGNDLFAFGINYNTVDHGGTPLFNGNISETKWRTANTDDSSLKHYRYSYDALNRITGAIDNTGRYNLADVTYDKMGNLETLKRLGWTSASPSLANNTGFGTMDDLVYTYDSGNKLTNVADNNASDTYGFVDANGSGTEYTYDVNGNMTSDANKGITSITYNHLNLPMSISINGNGNNGTISYIYDATGTKLRKTVGSSVTDYAGNFVYQNGQLQFFNHLEGYVTPDGQGSYDYVYNYKDHLGNVRLSFMDNNGTTEIVEENNYYPFGLEHKGYNDVVSPLGNSTAQRWKFGGKEYQEELGLEWYDVSARNYDPALGRWMNIDPLAEQMRRHSPYNYAFNNPIIFTDPDGMSPLLQIINLKGEIIYDDGTNDGDVNVALTFDSELSEGDQQLEITKDGKLVGDDGLLNFYVDSQIKQATPDADFGEVTVSTDADDKSETFATSIGGIQISDGKVVKTPTEEKTLDISIDRNKSEHTSLNNVYNLRSTLEHEEGHISQRGDTKVFNNSKEYTKYREEGAYKKQKQSPTFSKTTQKYKDEVNKQQKALK
ncbi:DUF6443 domain-containing protein [Flagellimonas sp. HMM57]|uniref:DUF6443 domain-containing protein n=1 Tax=unclassified Flagellimonas TaxID=2644544 RepID=UPI0013D7AE32|nr:MULTISPECIES: DUF6443 domain-containing protein [unclassified Flagellimonas]UII76992.1 DUF6443 domain-containing protein [Flagellimonas sp. HMM57]